MRSPSVMIGYWKDEAETARALDPKGWLSTGDVAEIARMAASLFVAVSRTSSFYPSAKRSIQTSSKRNSPAIRCSNKPWWSAIAVRFSLPLLF